MLHSFILAAAFGLLTYRSVTTFQEVRDNNLGVEEGIVISLFLMSLFGLMASLADLFYSIVQNPLTVTEMYRVLGIGCAWFAWLAGFFTLKYVSVVHKNRLNQPDRCRLW